MRVGRTKHRRGITVNLTKLGSPTLRRLRDGWAEQLEHKDAVMVAHRPGTSHHTQARRDAESLRLRIQQVETVLERRERKAEV
jgi:hypothetical protein